MKAFGCSLNLSYSECKKIKSLLIVAKSKVAPAKKVKTLPRLQLCMSHLLAKLWCMVKPKLDKYTIENINFWGDSNIVLHWLKTHPSALHTFVSNRVAVIREKTLEHTCLQHRIQPTLYHVDEEINSSIWFTGPEFLQKSFNEWPKNPNFELTTETLSL